MSKTALLIPRTLTPRPKIQNGASTRQLTKTQPTVLLDAPFLVIYNHVDETPTPRSV